MLISFILSVMVDKVMYGISAGKMALIVTDHAREWLNRSTGPWERFYLPQGQRKLF